MYLKGYNAREEPVKYFFISLYELVYNGSEYFLEM